jgi:hypothetical protein
VSDVQGTRLPYLKARSVATHEAALAHDATAARVSSAFVALTRQQCGYAAGDASALRTLMLALRRDDRKYEFAPIWFSAEDVIAAGKEEISRRDALEMDKPDRDKIDEAAVEQRDRQNRALEERLRRENGPRARALKDEVDGAVKADAMRPLSDKPRAATETQRQFPVFGKQWRSGPTSGISGRSNGTDERLME